MDINVIEKMSKEEREEFEFQMELDQARENFRSLDIFTREQGWGGNHFDFAYKAVGRNGNEIIWNTEESIGIKLHDCEICWKYSTEILQINAIEKCRERLSLDDQDFPIRIWGASNILDKYSDKFQEFLGIVKDSKCPQLKELYEPLIWIKEQTDFYQFEYQHKDIIPWEIVEEYNLNLLKNQKFNYSNQL